MSGHALQAPNASAKQKHQEYVTMRIDGQLFGITVMRVQDVLRGLKVTHVPLAPKEINGAMNLRGRIVTVIDLRQCLNLPPSSEGTPRNKIMSVVVEHKGEYFSLIVDNVGEVVNLAGETMEKTPANLTSQWKEVAAGVFKLQNELLVILDVQKLLRF